MSLGLCFFHSFDREDNSIFDHSIQAVLHVLIYGVWMLCSDNIHKRCSHYRRKERRWKRKKRDSSSSCGSHGSVCIIMSVVAVVIGQMTVVVIRDHSFRLILTKYPMHQVTIWVIKVMCKRQGGKTKRIFGTISNLESFWEEILGNRREKKKGKKSSKKEHYMSLLWTLFLGACNGPNVSPSDSCQSPNL